MKKLILSTVLFFLEFVGFVGYLAVLWGVKSDEWGPFATIAISFVLYAAGINLVIALIGRKVGGVILNPLLQRISSKLVWFYLLSWLVIFIPGFLK